MYKAYYVISYVSFEMSVLLLKLTEVLWGGGGGCQVVHGENGNQWKGG